MKTNVQFTQKYNILLGHVSKLLTRILDLERKWKIWQ